MQRRWQPPGRRAAPLRRQARAGQGWRGGDGVWEDVDALHRSGRLALGTGMQRPCAPPLPPAPPDAPLPAWAPPPLQAAFAQLQQQRHMAISVDVPYGNVDKAWRSLTRKVREEQYMVSAQGRQYYIKPSERRKLAASASEKKRRKEHFRCVCSAGHLGVAVAWRPAGCCLVAAAAAGRPASLHWASS